MTSLKQQTMKDFRRLLLILASLEGKTISATHQEAKTISAISETT
jgi:hypothetical protein